ncbi:MAG: hypothetical protein EA416_02345 [Trueperaceae bacterium]|nr:MAG: hypothetical protein EA416_02345 [Trueperaceae bacterium]
MTDRNDRDPFPAFDDEHSPDGEGLHPTGEGVSETPIHSTYEAIAQRNDLARQLEDVLASARTWARNDGSPQAHAIADALGEIYERLGEPSEADTAG